MEGSSAPVGAQTRPTEGTIRLTQVGLLVASLGAFLVVFDLFGLGVVGIFLTLGGAVLATPGGVRQGWWVAVLAGAIVVGLSKLIAEDSEVLGGWLAVIGAVTVLIGTTLGFPI
jgi:hypothetical protein